MNVQDKLLKEFEAAIAAVFGDAAYEEFENVPMSTADLLAIARKVAFYLDLD